MKPSPRDEARVELEQLREAVWAVIDVRRAYVEDRAAEADVDMALDALAERVDAMDEMRKLRGA